MFAARTALITGAGPIGLLAALATTHYGLETYVVDIVDSGPKPDLVRELGAHYHAGSASAIWTSRPRWSSSARASARSCARPAPSPRRARVIALTGISAAPADSGGRPERVQQEHGAENKVLFGSVNAARAHYEMAARVLSQDRPGLAATR